jgi:hypothetical protein
MNKEKWVEFYGKQKKNIMYWGIIILLVDLFLIAQQAMQFAQTGQCRTYMDMGSKLASCSTGEFVKYGWQWISFTDTFLLIPAAVLMIVATYAVDMVFVKKD